MRLGLLLASMLVASVSSAAPAKTKYALKSECHVRANAGGLEIDEVVRPKLHATVSGPDDDVTVELEGEGDPCTLKGKRAANVVTLTPGQKCPQTLHRNGVQVVVDSVLTTGKAVTSGKKIVFTSQWNLTGKAKVAFKVVDVKGTVDAKGEGTKVTS